MGYTDPETIDVEPLLAQVTRMQLEADLYLGSSRGRHEMEQLRTACELGDPFLIGVAVANIFMAGWQGRGKAEEQKETAGDGKRAGTVQADSRGREASGAIA